MNAGALCRRAVPVLSSLNSLTRPARPYVSSTSTSTTSILSLPSQCLPKNVKTKPRPQLCRHASSHATEAREQVRRYPERINIYRAGTSATLAIGMVRVGTIVFMLVGTGLYAPAYYFSPDHSNLWVPAFIIASAVPFIATSLLTSSMVHAVRVYLPSKARRSKDDLKHFASHTPPHTLLQLQFMRWLPWPQTRSVAFHRLRRMRPSIRAGWANLEHQTPAAIELQTKSWLGRLLHRQLGVFHINRAQKTDRSAVPGVFELMWRQIPEKGSKEDKLMREMRKERAPAQMRGRANTRTV